jgi:reactive intermediate/imine deaminase
MHYSNAYLVSGKPHILLDHEKSKAWASLHKNYEKIRQDIERSDADLILVYSTQWLSVIGHLVQADPNPKWLHVDPDWYDMGEMPYKFKVDADFSAQLKKSHNELGLESALVNYRGFPIDTGTIVALKHINPDNRLPVSMVSCNMYAEKSESTILGVAAKNALIESGKKAAIVVVSSLSNRFFTTEINPQEDKISSKKDDEWNQKVLELFAQGRLEDVIECAREFAHEANADMNFKSMYWLSGIVGKSNNFTGTVYDYQPVWGTGNALVKLVPSKESYTATDSRSKDFDDLIIPEKKTSTSKSSNDSINKSANAETFEATATNDDMINSDKAPLPVGPYPHARREGDLLYLSGVGPRTRDSKKIPGLELDDDGEIISYDVAVQTQSVINNIRNILEAAGSSFDKIIDVQVFLTNMKADFKAFNEVYKQNFTTNQPTRTTVAVLALPTPIAVEFKVIAKV